VVPLLRVPCWAVILRLNSVAGLAEPALSLMGRPLVSRDSELAYARKVLPCRSRETRDVGAG
jgi:hypothetical protein